MDLPRPPITRILFDNFISSVHWFMMVFHEPSVRTELEEVLTSDFVQYRRPSFFVLVLTILAIGAKYTANDALHEESPGFDLAVLQSKLIQRIEEHFLDIFDEDNIEAVQVCVLLSSYYFYHSRPKRAFVVLGTALKSADALGLNRECEWGRIDSVTREVRRRVWWALYVCDGYGIMLQSPFILPS